MQLLFHLLIFIKINTGVVILFSVIQNNIYYFFAPKDYISDFIFSN
jgi:hypothetical protein